MQINIENSPKVLETDSISYFSAIIYLLQFFNLDIFSALAIVFLKWSLDLLLNWTG